VLTSVISAGYYLPVIMAMYMKAAPSDELHRDLRLFAPAAGAIALSLAAVLVFGFWPRGALDAAVDSAGTLTQAGTPVARQ
jgi:NADH:ubiquinone oxidoreductase subunit 2 (subunit N)